MGSLEGGGGGGFRKGGGIRDFLSNIFLSARLSICLMNSRSDL